MSKTKATSLAPNHMPVNTGTFPTADPTRAEKPTVQTVKLDAELHRRLRMYGIDRKLKGQAIMEIALREYLDREGA